MSGQDLAAHPHLKRWFDAVAARPAVRRAYAWVEKINPPKALTPEEEAAQRQVLYGQDASTVRR